MDNQHKKITGYRDLSQTEIDLMNRIKAQGAVLQTLMNDVQAHVQAQHKAASPAYAETTDDEPFSDQCLDTPEQLEVKSVEMSRLQHAEPFRWTAIARTDFQTGLMALTRAVAQPSSF